MLAVIFKSTDNSVRKFKLSDNLKGQIKRIFVTISKYNRFTIYNYLRRNSNKANNNNLEDLKINVKIRLSALWTSVTLCYLYGDYFELYIPKKVEGLVSGENILDSPTKLFFASVLLVIPALMVFLSIILKPSINRWLNIISGIFFTTIMLLIAVTSIAPWRTFYVFLAIVESVITSLIVWYAWKWRKQ